MLGSALLAVVLFVFTDIDDVFLLMAYLANPRYLVRDVVIGQYLGIGALVAVSVAASLVSLVVSREVVGLLGLLPIAIGVKELLALRGDGNDSGGDAAAAEGNALSVAAVTIANGGDNIGVYTPVFATSTPAELAVMVAVFAVMVVPLIAFAYWLVNHRALGAPIRRYGHIVTPVVLIGVGAYVLHTSESLRLLA
jgi:cadmium resistance protein CadD (predicted permease)